MGRVMIERPAPVADEKPFVIGEYTGNNSSLKSVILGFKPSAVIVKRKNNGTTSGGYMSILQLMVIGGTDSSSESSRIDDTYPKSTLKISDDGFTITLTHPSLNTQWNDSGTTYTYMALR